MKEFTIRAYGRMELAQLYSPELTDIAAYRKMKKWNGVPDFSNACMIWATNPNTVLIHHWR